MTTKQFWTSTTFSVLICLAIAGAVLKVIVWPAPAPSPSPAPQPIPVPAPPMPDVSLTGIAQQKAKLQLSDGRTATFRFAISAGTLCCTAAVGLDQVISYGLLPMGDPAPPSPLPPVPVPTPTPPVPNPPTPPTPPPTPPSGNLRVLFLYDPLSLIDMPQAQQAILSSPDVRTYLDRHCPVESGCASGRCPLTATTRTPSYRFLPNNADVSRLTPVWQQTVQAAAGNPVPWMIAVNEAGQTVINQAWPATAEQTLALLKTFGGP